MTNNLIRGKHYLQLYTAGVSQTNIQVNWQVVEPQNNVTQIFCNEKGRK